jgi:hypothetical protein
MATEYTGDITGTLYKNQSMFSPSRFGGEQSEVTYINYYFNEDDVKDILTEIEDIKQHLGNTKLNTIKEFFQNETALELYGITNNDMVLYSDLMMGSKIHDIVINKGYCEFKMEA